MCELTHTCPSGIRMMLQRPGLGPVTFGRGSRGALWVAVGWVGEWVGEWTTYLSVPLELDL